MEKLIRDTLADVIRKRDPSAVIRPATDKEYPTLLRAKLLEEVHEFLDAESVEELADVVEVLDALMALYKIDPAMLAHVKTQKAKKHGQFKSRSILKVTK